MCWCAVKKLLTHSLPLLAKTDPPCSAVSAIAELLIVTADMLRHAVTLNFDSLMLNVHKLAVTRSNPFPNFSEIEQLLIIAISKFKCLASWIWTEVDFHNSAARPPGSHKHPHTKFQQNRTFSPANDFPACFLERLGVHRAWWPRIFRREPSAFVRGRCKKLADVRVRTSLPCLDTPLRLGPAGKLPERESRTRLLTADPIQHLPADAVTDLWSEQNPRTDADAIFWDPHTSGVYYTPHHLSLTLYFAW